MSHCTVAAAALPESPAGMARAAAAPRWRSAWAMPWPTTPSAASGARCERMRCRLPPCSLPLRSLPPAHLPASLPALNACRILGAALIFLAYRQLPPPCSVCLLTSTRPAGFFACPPSLTSSPSLPPTLAAQGPGGGGPQVRGAGLRGPQRAAHALQAGRAAAEPAHLAPVRGGSVGAAARALQLQKCSGIEHP